MWCESEARRSIPKASKIRESFSSSRITKLRLPAAAVSGSTSKPSWKARLNSRGRRAAKSGLAVMMRISRAVKLWQ